MNRSAHSLAVKRISAGMILLAMGACSNGERPRTTPSSAVSQTIPPIPVAGQELTFNRDMEPEEGTYGQTEPTPYELRLRHKLLGDHAERRCQLLAKPSFEPEFAVYIASDEHGASWVVHKRFDASQSVLLRGQLERLSQHHEDDSPEPTRSQLEVAMAKVNGTTELFKARIDTDTAERLSNACEAALKRTRVQTFLGTLDGVRYHASHDSRQFPVLTGQTHSPSNGTVAGDYVLLGETLATYCTSSPQARDGIRLKLLAIAETLFRRAASTN